MRHAHESITTAVSIAIILVSTMPATPRAQTGPPPSPARGTSTGATPAAAPSGAPSGATTPATTGMSGASATDPALPLPFPPRRDYGTKRTVRASYDKFADTTTLSAALPLTGVWEALYKPIVNMDLEAVYQGRVPATPPSTVHMTVHVSKWAADAARTAADSARLQSAQIIFVVDDSDRVRLPLVPTVTEKSLNDTTRTRMVQVLVDESVDVPIASFLRLANARRIVDAKAGQVVFSIKNDELNALRDFASRLSPTP